MVAEAPFTEVSQFGYLTVRACMRVAETETEEVEDPSGRFYFHPEYADHVVDFFEHHLAHFKGRWKGKRFRLSPWQRTLLRCAFGWLRTEAEAQRLLDELKALNDDLDPEEAIEFLEHNAHTRRFRVVFVFIPRKNGKSTLAAGIALYLTSHDGEAGAEVYSAAADREQANIVFGTAKAMAQASAPLVPELNIFSRSIVHPETLSTYQAISSETNTKHGYNSHGVVFDELHTQTDRDLWDVLITSMGSRSQPMMFVITTAGYDQTSICYEQYDYAKRVDNDEIDDPTFLPFLCEADKDDDWHDPEVWKRANPNLGVSIPLDYFEQEHRRACESPAYENTFKRLHLNIWTEQETRWLPVEVWDRNIGAIGRPYVPNDLAGRECVIAIDASSTTDLTCMCGVFPISERVNRETVEYYDVLWKVWMPGDNVEKLKRRDHVPYDVWIRDGEMVQTAGDYVDQDAIRAEVNRWGRIFNVVEVAVDPYNTAQLMTQLQDDGFDVVEFRQGILSISPACKLLHTALMGARIRHGGHRVARWAATNITVKIDENENIKPIKPKTTGRIDPVIALIMGLGRAILREGDGGDHLAEHGIREV